MKLRSARIERHASFVRPATNKFQINNSASGMGYGTRHRGVICKKEDGVVEHMRGLLVRCRKALAQDSALRYSSLHWVRRSEGSIDDIVLTEQI